jgi:hypothetical protein
VIEEFLQQGRDLERAKIVSETARIPWLELQRFFAAGKVMLVAAELDLVDVAHALQLDDVEQVKKWTENLQLSPVSDAEAKQWVADDASLWAVVIKPWVLVQTITP